MNVESKKQYSLSHFFVAMTLVTVSIFGGYANFDALSKNWSHDPIPAARNFILLWIGAIVATQVFLPFLFKKQVQNSAWLFVYVFAVLILANFVAIFVQQ